MILPGECINVSHTVCIECETELSLMVCASTARYHIGFFCPNWALIVVRVGIMGVLGRLNQYEGGGLGPAVKFS